MESGVQVQSSSGAGQMADDLTNGYVRPLWLTQHGRENDRYLLNGTFMNDLGFESGASCTLFANVDAVGRESDKGDANGFLVNHRSRLENAMVNAARDNNILALEVALEHYMQLVDLDGLYENSGTEDLGCAKKPVNFLPLVVGAQLGNYEVINFLLSQGFELQKPHNVLCKCETCQGDGFRESQRRLDIYRGLANPVFIAITSKDPFNTAFELSSELKVLERLEDEYEKDYLLLSQQCSQFTLGLLDECRTAKEQRNILDYPGENGSEADFTEGSLGLINCAISFDQKEFVAHPYCQHLVMHHIFGDVSGWRTNNFLYRISYVIIQVFIFPLLAILYFFLPFLEVGRKIKRPFIKFINHTVSFVTFLSLLAFSSHQKFNIRFNEMPSTLEWVILMWILGIAWSECKQIWHEGAKRYFSSGWNWMDMAMVFLILGAYIVWTSILLVDFGIHGKDTHDVLLSTADGMYSFGVVASFFRLIYLCQISRYLGLLQLSLSRMVRVIFQFAFISCVVLVSFSVAMSMLYMSSFEAYKMPRPAKNYSSQLDSMLDKGYHNLLTTMVTLMWASLDMVGLASLDVFNSQSLIQFWSASLFTLYHAASMIVLLNMLIAMMSNSYQQVEDNIETEYKFARTQLWADYIGDGVPTLPPPLNLLPTPKYIVRGVCRLTNRCFGLPKNVPCLTEGQLCIYDGGRFNVEQRKQEYKNIVRELLSRYWSRRRKDNSPVETADRMAAMKNIKDEVSDMLSEIRNILKARGRMKGRDRVNRLDDQPTDLESVTLDLHPQPTSLNTIELAPLDRESPTCAFNRPSSPTGTTTERTNHVTEEASEAQHKV